MTYDRVMRWLGWAVILALLYFTPNAIQDYRENKHYTAFADEIARDACIPARLSEADCLKVINYCWPKRKAGEAKCWADDLELDKLLMQPGR